MSAPPLLPAPETGGEGPRTRWWAIFGLWSIPALIDLNQRYTMQAHSGGDVVWWPLIVGAALWYSWALLTPAILWLTRRAPIAPPRRGRNLLIHAAAGSLVAVALIAVLAVFDWPLEGQPLEGQPLEGRDAPPAAGYGERVARGLASGYPSLMMVYGVLVAIGMGLDLRRRYRQGQLRSARLERRLAEAQLAALRMQLQPHFLFNTLHAISALMDEDVAAARRMIARLSELLRVTLASDGEPEVPLEREIEVLERYLDIERVRLGDRLRVEYAVDDDAREALVPTLLLQPLVENAVRHGIAPRARGGRVRIGGRIDGATLRLSVADDGPGLRAGDAAESPAEGEGIGLANTRARLAQRFGPAAQLELASDGGRGLEVRIAMPLSRAPAAAEAGR